MWAGEVQMQALSAALSRPIYSYVEFESDSKKRQYIPSNISSKQLLDRFHEKTLSLLKSVCKKKAIYVKYRDFYFHE